MNLFENLQRYTDASMKDFTEMARVGITDDNYEIYVNTNDSGKIPHFHYRKANDWVAFHTCIKIEKAEYFHHGNNQDILNSKQKKELVEFLKDKPKSKRYETNWDLLVEMWNLNNSDVEIDEGVEMPDYRNLY